MNQNIALRFELSEDAAQIADASLIVRARFVEAADTLGNMEVMNLRPAAIRSFWPSFPAETIGGVTVGYAINGNRVRHRPSASAISRAEEVMYGWMLEYVGSEERRYLLGRWSVCMAAPHISGSFRELCQKENRIRRTAERHIQSEFESISSALIKNAKSLHEPDWSRVSPMMPNSAIDLVKVRTAVPKHETHWLPASAKPSHNPDSPELAALIKRLTKANRKRRGSRAA